MLALITRACYWPRMEVDVEAYVRSCLVCHKDKVERRVEARLLQAILIPERSLVVVSVDFIIGFPKVKGMSLVMVVVDRFSKYAISIAASHACPADLVADMFYKNVVKYFELQTNIVSDRDTQFTMRF